jgi:multiple sugar transport system substrate-binding protein
MKRSIALISLMFIIGAAAVFAGGGQQAQSQKVVFWCLFTGDQADAVRKVVDAYNATNPPMQVEMSVVPGSITDDAKLMTAVRAGTGPDVYLLNRFLIAQRAATGFLEDITDPIYAVDPAIATRYLDRPWEDVHWKGKIYGLPFDTDARALFYNRTVLRDAGIDPDILDPKNGPITVAQLRELSDRINQKDAQGNYTRIGFTPMSEQGFHYLWGHVWGGSFVDTAAGKVTPTDPKNVQAMKWAQDWVRDLGPEQLRTFNSTYSPPNNPPQQDPFFQNRIGMMSHGNWLLSSIRQYAPNLDFGITYLPVPKAGDKPSTFAGGWSLVVPKGAKHVSDAARFLVYLCGSEGQRSYCKDFGQLPTYKSILDDDSIYDSNFKIFRETLPIAQGTPVSLPVNAVYWDKLNTAWNAIIYDQADSYTVLKIAEDETQAELNQYLPLR